MLRLKDILRDNRGVTAIEYALIASLVSVAAIVGYHNLGAEVQNSFQEIDQNLGRSLSIDAG
jgi:pilus assembly protein Flp/PilA